MVLAKPAHGPRKIEKFRRCSLSQVKPVGVINTSENDGLNKNMANNLFYEKITTAPEECGRLTGMPAQNDKSKEKSMVVINASSFLDEIKQEPED